MSDSKSANADFNAMGKNKDSSGVYFDKNGKPIVNTGFIQPTVDISVAIKDLEEQLKQIPSFKIVDGEYRFLAKEHESTFKISYSTTDYKGAKSSESIQVYFNTADASGENIFTRRVSTDWWFKNEREYRAAKADVYAFIGSASSDWLANNLSEKSKSESSLANDQKNSDKLASDEVKKVADLLGIKPEDALSYLAAGHTVDEAASKVAKWNLASPSTRALMMAQDALSLSEDSNRAFEHVAGKTSDVPKLKATPVDDLYKGIRNPYSERKATKAYISLVKENTGITSVDSVQTLLKLEKFYMQSVSEVDSEKYQIVETFNKPKIYFFDRRARIYNYSFEVENTGNTSVDQEINEPGGNHWRDIFKNVYDQYLRGTKSVENRVKAVIHYDEVTRIGYVLSCSMSMNAQNDNLAEIQITMFVEDEKQRDVSIDFKAPEFEVVEVKVNNASEIDKPTTTPYIVGDFKGNGTSLTSLVVPNINNTKEPGRQTFSLQENINIKLVEINVEDKNPSTSSGIPTEGNCVIKSITWDALDGRIFNESNPELDGILVCVNTYDKNSQNIGVPFKVKKGGTKLWVVMDTTGKLAKYINENSINDSINQINYEVTLVPENSDKEFKITGAIMLAPKVTNLVVSSPGKCNAITSEIVKTGVVVKLTGCKDWDWDKSSSLDKKLFTSSFDIQITEKGSTIPLPILGDSFIPINFTKSEFKGSIQDDSGNIEGVVTLVKKDDKTLTCNVKITCLLGGLDKNELSFTAESCKLSGKTKIGNVDLNVEMVFTRGVDNKGYTIIGIFPAAQDPKRVFLIPMNSNNGINIVSKIDLVFDKDPGPGIVNEFQLESGGSMAVIRSNGKSEVDCNCVISNSRTLLSPINKENIQKYSLTTRFGSINPPRKISKDDSLLLYGIKTDSDLYVVVVNIVLFSANTYMDILKSSIPSNSLATYTSMMKNIIFNGNIKIAKTKFSSSLVLRFTNSSTEGPVPIPL